MDEASSSSGGIFQGFCYCEPLSVWVGIDRESQPHRMRSSQRSAERPRQKQEERKLRCADVGRFSRGNNLLQRHEAQELRGGVLAASASLPACQLAPRSLFLSCSLSLSLARGLSLSWLPTNSARRHAGTIDEMIASHLSCCLFQDFVLDYRYPYGGEERERGRETARKD